MHPSVIGKNIKAILKQNYLFIEEDGDTMFFEEVIQETSLVEI